MAENTKIQWADHTFNPWRGCTKIAPGCANCYADAQSKRNPGTLGVWGPNGTRVVASEAMWREPVKWNRSAQIAAKAWDDMSREVSSLSAEDGEAYLTDAELTKPPRPRVFCASLADVFEDWRGAVSNARGEALATFGGGYRPALKGDDFCMLTLDDVRSRLFRLWRSTLNLDYLALTKRPENARRMLDGRHENLWLGTSIANQEDADRNIPELLKCRDLCAKLFLSVEPLIGPVDFRLVPGFNKCGQAGLDITRNLWVIVGGESGPHARPCNVEWIRLIVRQCQAAGVPCFVKQLGANAQHSHGEPVGWPERTRLRDPKGGDPAEWPEDLRVREVPQ